MTRTEENSDKFDEILTKYQNEAGNDYDGVSIMLSQSTDDFEFIEEEDLSIAKSSSLEQGFKYQTKVDQIAFDLSTKGYKCN